MEQNKLLQIEAFVVCPNCKQPYIPERLLQEKGAARNYNACGNCGFLMRIVLQGTPCKEGVEPVPIKLKYKFPLSC